MTAFIIRRLMQSALVVLAMSVIVFFGVNVVGDPVQLLISPEATQKDIEEAIRTLGLDRPLWEQYFHFVSGAARGDLGKSFIHGTSALKLILSHMPATLELAFAAIVLAIVIGIPLGLYAGLRPESYGAKTIMAGSILGFSLPTFWVGLMLIMVFAVMLERAGFVPALFALLVGSAVAGPEFRWREVLAMAAVLTAACALVFVIGLGLPYRLVVLPW